MICSPEKNDYYQQVAYLDVTGRNQRLSLGLFGAGRGPQVTFNVKVLDINDIFIQATHDYHIVVKNTGMRNRIYNYLLGLFNGNTFGLPISDSICHDNRMQKVILIKY